VNIKADIRFKWHENKYTTHKDLNSNLPFFLRGTYKLFSKISL